MKLRSSRKFRLLWVILLAWLLIHLIFISYDGLRPFRGRADVAIVLGNMVRADSSLSPVLEGRVKKALQLYQAGRVHKLFVSGGPGEEGVREGDAMKSWLVKRAVPADDIIADNFGKNTYCTAVDFMKLNDSLHFSSAVIVTSFYHITRTRYILRKEGYSRLASSASDEFFWNDWFSLLREFFAFYKYLIWY